MNVGIIGNGSIVKLWMAAAIESKVVNLVSGYVRKEEKKAFFEDSGILEVYTDLEEFLASPKNEVIYIALPNSLHYEFALKAIRAGKHVILEKPFTSNQKEALHLFDEASKHNVCLFEGICNIYDPNFIKMKELIDQPTVVYSTFNQLSSKYLPLTEGKLPNVFNPAFSGGVLMDLIVYQIHACYEIFGKPVKVTYFPRKFKNGIDLSGTVIMEYENFHATLIASKEAESEDSFVCLNAKNAIRTEGGISLMKGFYLNDDFRSYSYYDNYLAYEIEAFHAVLKNKDKEKYEEMKQSTLEVMKILDDCRKSGGIVFTKDTRELG